MRSFVEPVSVPESEHGLKQGLSSFFDWHHASKKKLKTAAEGRVSQQEAVQPASPVAHLVQHMSLDLGDHDADTSSDDAPGEGWIMRNAIPDCVFASQPRCISEEILPFPCFW